MRRLILLCVLLTGCVSMQVRPRTGPKAPKAPKTLPVRVEVVVAGSGLSSSGRRSAGSEFLGAVRRSRLFSRVHSLYAPAKGDEVDLLMDVDFEWAYVRSPLWATKAVATMLFVLLPSPFVPYDMTVALEGTVKLKGIDGRAMKTYRSTAKTVTRGSMFSIATAIRLAQDSVQRRVVADLLERLIRDSEMLGANRSKVRAAESRE